MIARLGLTQDCHHALGQDLEKSWLNSKQDLLAGHMLHSSEHAAVPLIPAWPSGEANLCAGSAKEAFVFFRIRQLQRR